MQTCSDKNTIYIVAAIIMDEFNQLLLVRKKGSAFFMQAGGKIESGETPLATLQRELQEELAVCVEAEQCTYLGHFTAPAANEAGYEVDAHIFQVHMSHRTITAHAEIEEVVWSSITDAKQLILAPLTKEILIPLIERQ